MREEERKRMRGGLEEEDAGKKRGIGRGCGEEERKRMRGRREERKRMRGG